MSASERWWSPYREVGAIAVIHVDLTPHVAHEASASLWLDGNERARARKFEHPGARRRYVLCRAALRAILCERLGCDNGRLSFGEGEHGKPFALVDDTTAEISFNLSHGGGHGLIAIAPEGRVGVDVEERADRRDFDRLIEEVFTPNEQAELNGMRGRRRIALFYKFWTIKEALIKALGTGFSLHPATFEAPEAMRRGAPRSIFRFPHIPGTQWQVEYIGSERFAATIAYETVAYELLT